MVVLIGSPGRQATNHAGKCYCQFVGNMGGFVVEQTPRNEAIIKAVGQPCHTPAYMEPDKLKIGYLVSLTVNSETGELLFDGDTIVQFGGEAMRCLITREFGRRLIFGA